MAERRLNPKTKKLFRRGDFDKKTSKYFLYYSSHVNSDGLYSERWVTKERYNQEAEQYKVNQQNYAKQNRKLKLPKRLNPLTDKEFQVGEKNGKGQYFIGYVTAQRAKGSFMGEAWGSEEAYLKTRVGYTFYKIKRRAKENKIPLNIDNDYLYSMLIKTKMKCPITDIDMVFGGDRFTSPSIDRLIPKKGYVKGNIAWVSLLANTIKSDKTPRELRQIADWIERQPIYKRTFPS